MRKLLLFLPILALAACQPATSDSVNGSNTAVIVGTVQLDGVKALGAAEAAFTALETVATAAIKTGRLPAATVKQINALVQQGRSYRATAREVVNAGGDASAAIDSLNGIVTQLGTLVPIPADAA